MDIHTRKAGLEELLKHIYGPDTGLETLLRELGLETAQVEHLLNGQLEIVITQLLEVIHRRLTSDSGKDTYYRILSRRYGLDGEPPQPLSAIAGDLGYSPDSLRQLSEEILQRCRSKTWQTELRKRLKYIAVERLGETQKRPARDYVAEKLERLSNLRNAAEFTRLDYETRRNQVLKQVQAELDELDLEFRPVLERVEENIAALENEIKTDVLLCGESVSGGMYRAIYTRGRVSWDSEGIAGYSEAHPEVLQFRRQGQPSVSLRPTGRD